MPCAVHRTQRLPTPTVGTGVPDGPHRRTRRLPTPIVGTGVPDGPYPIPPPHPSLPLGEGGKNL